MAIDTQLRRSSSSQMLLPFVLCPAFPSGGFSTFVKAACCHMYGGIAAAFSGSSILLKMLLHSGG